jgi:hypothetical protein
MMHGIMAAPDRRAVYCGMPSNVPVHADTISQPRLKAATVEWLDTFRWNMAATLVWNRSVGMERARQDLKDLVARVDRKLIGSHFHKLRSDKRTQAFFVFEGLGHDHVHVHSLWKAPKDRWWELGKMFFGQRGGVWNDVVETGSYDVEACNWNGSNNEIIGYVLKQQHRFSDPRQMVWASDFHRSR